METCQKTVPEAIIAFLESTGFEDALRNAVSLGGDSDTLACITGSIAEAFYGMPPELQQETLKRLPEEMRQHMSCSGRTLSAGCDTAGAAQTQAVFKKLRIVPEEQQNTRLRIVCKAQYMGGCGFVVVCSHCQNRSKHNFCGVPSSRYRI